MALRSTNLNSHILPAKSPWHQHRLCYPNTTLSDFRLFCLYILYQSTGPTGDTKSNKLSNKPFYLAWKNLHYLCLSEDLWVNSVLRKKKYFAAYKKGSSFAEIFWNVFKRILFLFFFPPSTVPFFFLLCFFFIVSWFLEKYAYGK